MAITDAGFAPAADTAGDKPGKNGWSRSSLFYLLNPPGRFSERTLPRPKAGPVPLVEARTRKDDRINPIKTLYRSYSYLNHSSSSPAPFPALGKGVTLFWSFIWMLKKSRALKAGLSCWMQPLKNQWPAAFFEYTPPLLSAFFCKKSTDVKELRLNFPYTPIGLIRPGPLMYASDQPKSSFNSSLRLSPMPSQRLPWRAPSKEKR